MFIQKRDMEKVGLLLLIRFALVLSAGYPPSNGGGYLPPTNGLGGGGGESSGPPIPIIKMESSMNIDGSYQYEYETGNGINVQESGYLKDTGGGGGGGYPPVDSGYPPKGSGDDKHPAIVVQGYFSFTSPEGQRFQVNYVADENGFQPEGDHLPTPPPIPKEIQQSLDKIAREGGHPSSFGNGNGGGGRNTQQQGYVY